MKAPVPLPRRERSTATGNWNLNAITIDMFSMESDIAGPVRPSSPGAVKEITKNIVERKCTTMNPTTRSLSSSRTSPAPTAAMKNNPKSDGD